MVADQARERDPALELGVEGVARIVVKIHNGDEKTLYRKTIPIRGKLRLWLIAAHKVLSTIASAAENYGKHATKAIVEIEGVEPNSAFNMFRLWVRKYSPLPVELYLVEKKPI